MSKKKLSADDFMKYFGETLSRKNSSVILRRDLTRFVIEKALSSEYSHLTKLDFELGIVPQGEKFTFPITIPLTPADRSAFQKILSEIGRMVFYPSFTITDGSFNIIVMGLVEGTPKLELQEREGRVTLRPASAYDHTFDLTRMVPGAGGTA